MGTATVRDDGRGAHWIEPPLSGVALKVRAAWVLSTTALCPVNKAVWPLGRQVREFGRTCEAEQQVLSKVLSMRGKKKNGLCIRNAQAVDFNAFNWWAHTDSNRGPKDYESSALTD